ncbi:MAG: PEP-CTERM sorting domain-containing protein [Caldimonas sp.]
MNMRKSILASALVLASAWAGAVPVAYEGVLVPSVAATGQVGGFSWFLDNGSGVDYWRFAGVAGQTVSFAVDRLNGNLDPGLSFYAGITSADTSLFSAGSSWGGLTFIGSLDDEKAAFLTPGPAGDPLGSFVLASTGNYTVVVGGANSTDAGSYAYRLTMTTAAAPIPEPSVWAMFGVGLAGLGYLGRRRRG